MIKRARRLYSIKDELIKKSQESALTAIQTFNNPLITFKSETFIVLMIISWTYLLHAYFKKKNIDYRYFEKSNIGKRRKFYRTKYGAYKYWELGKCLKHSHCPLDDATKDNLRFLIGVRNEIEHQMTQKIDDHISAKFQACCINYNNALKTLFGTQYGLDNTIPVSLQLFSFGHEQVDQLKNQPKLPKNLIEFISSFEASIDTSSNLAYSYKVIYTPVNVNREGQADEAVRFIPAGSEEQIEIQNVLVKHKQYNKLTQSDITGMMRDKGFSRFRPYDHQKFWQSKWKNAARRNEEAKQYGELVIKNIWLWYQETWLPLVEQYCHDNRANFE